MSLIILSKKNENFIYCNRLHIIDIILMNKDNIINFAYGGISGSVGVFISHPFDTLKTNFQANKSLEIKCNLNTLKNLYKGITPPIIGVGFEKAIVFGVYETTKYYLKYSQINENIKTSISGATAGLFASVIVTPFERIKILLQTDTKKININPKFYLNGISATFTRETPGFAIYFSVYEYLKKKYYTDKNNIITPYSSFLFGGISGTVSWLFIYPQDRIKTKMQSSIKTGTFTSTFKNIINQEGYRGLYKGFSYALMRAIPLHAGTFMTMELFNNYLKTKK